MYNKSVSYRSDYIRQHRVICTFNDNESWAILSAIEQSIKEKIERVGTPLKDWDIQINYGIKTGFNDAFIITGEKRKELIEKDPKSAEIIRPILRGRDIKRYSYDFADLWLINTHNGVKEKGINPIFIDDYPAIKEHLDNFYPQLEKRADQGDTPYNLRNCAYLEDFSKQKIVWKRVGSSIRFCYDEKECLALDSTCFATGNHIKYLTVILNSKMGNFLLQDSPKTGTGDLLISVQAIEPIRIPLISEKEENLLDNLFCQICNDVSKIEVLSIEEKINNIIYKLYNINNEEIEFIENN